MARKLSNSSNNASRRRRSGGKASKPSRQEKLLISDSTDKCLPTSFLSYFHFVTVIASWKKGLEKVLVLHNFVCTQIRKVLTDNLGWIRGILRNVKVSIVGSVSATCVIVIVVTPFFIILGAFEKSMNCRRWWYGSCLITSLTGLPLKLLNLLKDLLKSAVIICLVFGSVCWKAVKSLSSKTSSKKIRKCNLFVKTHTTRS